MHFDNTFKFIAWLWNINYNHKTHFVKKDKFDIGDLDDVDVHNSGHLLTCFAGVGGEADIIQDTPVWSHPFLFAAHVSLPPTLTGVASEATLGPWTRRSRRPPAGRAWPGPQPLRLRLRRPQLWLLLAHKPHPHQARDPDTTSKTSQQWPQRRRLMLVVVFRFPHWPAHQTAAPVQAWCPAMWAYSQGTCPVLNSSLSLRSSCNNNSSNCSNSNNNNNKPNSSSSSNNNQTRQRVFSGRSAPAPAAAAPPTLRMSTR